MSKRTIFYFSLAVLAFTTLSCKKFLDEKPDKKLTTPMSYKDLQLILDNEAFFNNNYPSCGEVASDNYFLSDVDYNSLAAVQRENYVWTPNFELASNWETPYISIYATNIVLDHIDKIKEKNLVAYNTIKGSALFLRANAFFKLAQLFAPPYEESTANRELGIPLVLTSDVNAINRRSTLAETYRRILSDLRECARLLPSRSTIPTRPDKAAAYALLAYTYLITGDCEKSNEFSDSSLAIANELIDYNTVQNSNNPFSLFNVEVLFQARIVGSTPLNPSRCRVDSVLLDLYSSDDLRRTLFFRQNPNGTFAFKGNYDGSGANPNLFCGIAVDETYLIKAESLARLGDKDEAMRWLNKLLQNRWRAGSFEDLTAETASEALDIILLERRKELAFRGGLRWTDLRRLNRDTNRQLTIRRVIDDEQHVLSPGDLRYTFLIPSKIIILSGIEQNRR